MAAVYAVGRENMRRVREVGGILWRRNWSVVKLTILVTRVSGMLIVDLLIVDCCFNLLIVVLLIVDWCCLLSIL